MGIFNIDNKFFRALNKLVDMVILSFCWIISCIPVFTIGAADISVLLVFLEQLKYSNPDLFSRLNPDNTSVEQ